MTATSASPSSADALTQVFLEGLKVGRLPLLVKTKNSLLSVGYLHLDPGDVANALRLLALDNHGDALYEPVKQGVGDEWTSTGEEAERELDDILKYIEDTHLWRALLALWSAAIGGTSSALKATLEKARPGRIRRCAIDRRHFTGTSARRDYCSKECAVVGKKKSDASRSRAEDMRRSRENQKRLKRNDFNQMVRQQQETGVVRNGVGPRDFVSNLDNPGAIAELAERVGNLALAKKAKSVSRYRNTERQTSPRNS